MRRAVLWLALMLTACGGAPEPAHAPVAAPAGPTVAEADQFIARLNADLLRMLPDLNAAQWVQATYITPDSQRLATRAGEEYLNWQARQLKESQRYLPLKNLPPDTARALMLLRNVSTPAPSEPKQQAELAALLSKLETHYASAQWCRTPQECLTLGQIEKIVSDPDQPPAARFAAWQGWHDTAKSQRADYQRLVALMNAGAREMGAADTGEIWRGGYDMPATDFSAEVERLWMEVAPLYEQLHCHARARLNAKYGEAVVPATGPIPAHLLGNVWAQQWGALYPLLEPYPGISSLEVTPVLVQAREREYRKQLALLTAQKKPLAASEASRLADIHIAEQMARRAEDFYVSLGFPKLPDSFWKQSLLTRPRDREVVCHASAWDLNLKGDVRIKMCTEATEEDLITLHHELGHIYYNLMVNPLPPMFQSGAHDGFHEAVGDTMTLSLTPEHLMRQGLLPPRKARDAETEQRATVNTQMRWALDKIVFLPWGKLVDQWRWQVFSGAVKPEQYNAAWWALREQYQGVSAPLPRSEDDFDPGAKYHITSNTPYTRYFLSFILQFQFQKALCDAAGYQGPLHACSVYGNAEAGKRFMDMLAAGASQPWPQTLELLTGSRQMSAAPLIEYFQPLMIYLRTQNESRSCGWRTDKETP